MSSDPAAASLLRLARAHTPAGLGLELNDRDRQTFVNWCLSEAERNYFPAKPRFELVWVFGGGPDTKFISAGPRHLILHGDLELRLRSLQSEAIEHVWGPGLEPSLLDQVQLRLAIELCRHRRPERVSDLIALAERIGFMRLPRIGELEAGIDDEQRYAALWSLSILHETGHWFATYNAGRESTFVEDALVGRSRQALDDLCNQLSADPTTAPWLDGFDPAVVAGGVLIDEAFSDKLMADVFFTLYLKHVQGTNWGLFEDPSTVDYEVAWLSVLPALEEFTRWFATIEWTLRLRALLELDDASQIGHRLVLLELRRKGLLEDFALYLADPSRLGGVFGATYEDTIGPMRERMEALTRKVRDELDPSMRRLAAYLDAGAQPRPSKAAVELHFLDIVEPRAGPLADLVSTTGARPAYHVVPGAAPAE